MPVPEAIRKVRRPVNTTVYDSKHEGPKRYFVRERNGCKYVKGKCPQPSYGKVIGYIYEGKFVAKNVPVALAQPDGLSFGGAAFAYSVCAELKQQLIDCFDLNDALSILTIALLRVIHPGVPDSRLSSYYEKSWINLYLPGMHLSANKVSTFLRHLGYDGQKRRKFFRQRLSAVSGIDHIAIDGTLKQDGSIVNDLSGFSYKSRLKGCRDISILYAFDIRNMVPLCAQVFPGNCIDASAYRQFIRENKIEKGIIIADKGFPPSKIYSELKDHPHLHYLSPVKRNDAHINDLKLLDFDGTFGTIRSQILYSKRQSPSGKYYYAFKDTGLEHKEQKDYLQRRTTHHDFDNGHYQIKKQKFGLIVFESDQDLSPATVYQCYQERWLLELMFKKYKSEEQLTDTRVQTDHSVWGSEFVNFIATVITCNMVKKANSVGILDDMTYGMMLQELNIIWRKSRASMEPKSDDGFWIHPFATGMAILEKLGLSKSVQSEIKTSKPKGRPRKKPVFVGPKRPRGRPKKILS